MKETNKKIIKNFYQEFFNEHHIEAADKYVKEDYIQHNPDVQQGLEGLKLAFAGKFVSQPDFRLDIKMIIAEDDMAAVYLKNVDDNGITRARVVDIYRMEEGKLAEHWDVLMPC